MTESGKSAEITGFLDALRGEEGDGAPTGGFRRMRKMLGAAAGTGLSVLSGRFRGKSESGLGLADMAAIEKLVKNLGELKGLAMKAGQIMSYIDDTLPPEMQHLLALLQTQSQPTRFSDIEQTIRDELQDRAGQLLAALDPTPVSVASIGQVHKGQLPDGTVVAVKVRHPGIKEALESDFRTAAIGPLMSRLVLPSGAATVKEFIVEAQERMLEECEYLLEAERQAHFGELYATHPSIVIPAVYQEWCSRSVLVTSWEPGMAFEDYLLSNPSQEERDRDGRTLFEFYFGSLYRYGLFHADPHPGNYVFRPGGTIVIYDFGCTRVFDRHTTAVFAHLAHAVRDDDISEIRSALEEFGATPPTRPKDFARLHKLLRGFFGPFLVAGPHAMEAGVTMEAGEIMRDKMALMRLHLPGKLLFLFRIRFGMYAVLARLGSVCDWAALEAELSQGLGGGKAKT